jgi:putative hemolysin
MKKILKRITIIQLFIFISCSNNVALNNEKKDNNIKVGGGNPAACYCVQMGYDFIIEKDSLGEGGYCIFPNGEKAEEWKFFRGQIYPEYSYCALKGFGLICDTINHGNFLQLFVHHALNMILSIIYNGKSRWKNLWNEMVIHCVTAKYFLAIDKHQQYLFVGTE